MHLIMEADIIAFVGSTGRIITPSIIWGTGPVAKLGAFCVWPWTPHRVPLCKSGPSNPFLCSFYVTMTYFAPVYQTQTQQDGAHGSADY